MHKLWSYNYLKYEDPGKEPCYNDIDEDLYDRDTIRNWGWGTNPKAFGDMDNLDDEFNKIDPSKNWAGEKVR